MHVPVDAPWGDLRRRPLVIARPVDERWDPAGLATSAKNAAGRGADLVEFPATLVGPGLVSVLDEMGIGVVAVAEAVADFSRVTSCGVAGVRWAGQGPAPVSERHRGVMFASIGEGLGAGDALVVRAGADAIQPGGGVHVVMDLIGVEGRAALAALTTLGLERGVHGFVTSSPSAVRRAAHVIRAVELAR